VHRNRLCDIVKLWPAFATEASFDKAEFSPISICSIPDQEKKSLRKAKKQSFVWEQTLKAQLPEVTLVVERK
jgi:hypothetical protein